MRAPSSIDAMTIDVHRMGSLSESGLIRKGERYIALSGSNDPPASPEMELEHEDFLRYLHVLRYPDDATNEAVGSALRILSAQAGRILPKLPPVAEGTAVQIDLVLGAAELWAFPFEACRVADAPAFVDPDRPLILTRRIRQGFATERRPWPVRPKLLFVHAPAAIDLSEELIEQHIHALESALLPWSLKGDPRGEGLVHVELVLGPRDVLKARAKAPYTHVHVLAHGKGIIDSSTGQVHWGLRFGDLEREASDPKELAGALKPNDGLPVAVTVASCDSANQAGTTVPKRSIAQELHGVGVPIVLASQLPLTLPGSVTLTRAFYTSLLSGQDVRWALHEARVALHGDGSAGHDWVSLVGYVQLPEGYGDHLVEVGVKCDMELLKAARRRLDGVFDAKDGAVEGTGRLLDEIEQEVRGRIASLERRLESIQRDRVGLVTEASGILSSAHKRLAEVLFQRGEQSGRSGDQMTKDAQARASRESLAAALDAYRRTFHANIQSHWLGTQQLALEAALHGAFAEERDWQTTFYAAELALAGNKSEYWAYGSIAELWLLAPIAGKLADEGKAKRALDSLRKGADEAGDSFAVVTTRDQLRRYVRWWTNGNGFFANRQDLAVAANELLLYLGDDEKGR